MSAPITTSRIDWRGVAISIDYRIRRFHGDFDHLEIRVLGDGIIPITETGYRSHWRAKPIRQRTLYKGY
ncbi:MAG: hypothetical protein ACWA49_06885 [Ruegeria sp.]